MVSRQHISHVPIPNCHQPLSNCSLLRSLNQRSCCFWRMAWISLRCASFSSAWAWRKKNRHLVTCRQTKTRCSKPRTVPLFGLLRVDFHGFGVFFSWRIPSATFTVCKVWCHFSAACSNLTERTSDRILHQPNWSILGKKRKRCIYNIHMRWPTCMCPDHVWKHTYLETPHLSWVHETTAFIIPPGTSSDFFRVVRTLKLRLSWLDRLQIHNSFSFFSMVFSSSSGTSFVPLWLFGYLPEVLTSKKHEKNPSGRWTWTDWAYDFSSSIKLWTCTWAST